MDTRQLFTSLAAVLIFLLVALSSTVYALIVCLDKLNSISSDMGKAVVAGGVTVVVSVLSLVIGKLWEQNVKIRHDVREKKIPVYEKQMEVFFGALFASKFGKKPDEKVLGKAFVSFTEKLIIWGGPEVIRAWSAFRSHDWQNSAPKDSFTKLEEFIRAIRSDLGNKNSGLQPGELIRLFVNDYDSSLLNRPTGISELIHNQKS